jgi:hypothetical protein
MEIILYTTFYCQAQAFGSGEGCLPECSGKGCLPEEEEKERGVRNGERTRNQNRRIQQYNCKHCYDCASNFFCFCCFCTRIVGNCYKLLIFCLPPLNFSPHRSSVRSTLNQALKQQQYLIAFFGGGDFYLTAVH